MREFQKKDYFKLYLRVVKSEVQIGPGTTDEIKLIQKAKMRKLEYVLRKNRKPLRP